MIKIKIAPSIKKKVVNSSEDKYNYKLHKYYSSFLEFNE